jgi:hypothetical protein
MTPTEVGYRQSFVTLIHLEKYTEKKTPSASHDIVHFKSVDHLNIFITLIAEI